MKLTNLTPNHPWNLILSKDDVQKPETWEQLKELHILGKIKPGDKIYAKTGNISNNLSRLAKMFAGEYKINENCICDGNYQQELVRISPSITANIWDKIPRSLQELESQLYEKGHILIRANPPLNEEQLVDLMGGKKELINYNKYGNRKRSNIPDSIYLDVSHWAKELEILPHNELTYHINFPQKVCFICKQPSLYGGETTIYDCQKAFANLSPSFQKEVVKRNCIFIKRYVKQLNHFKYPSWQNFLTENSTSEDAIAHFNKLGYTCCVHREFDHGEMVEVVETQIKRPISYFYQGKICLYASVVGTNSYWYEKVWGDKVPSLLEVKWENGESFSDEEFSEMHEALKSARIVYNNWKKDDVLILDNLRIAHGRLPFIGKRLVGTLMAGKIAFEFKNNEWIVKKV